MIKFWLSYDNLKIVAKFMKMRNHDHIKGEKGENHIISQVKSFITWLNVCCFLKSQVVLKFSCSELHKIGLTCWIWSSLGHSMDTTFAASY